MVGTRDWETVPEAARELYLAAVRYGVSQGAWIATGACQGADQRGAVAALEAGGRVALYLPWHNYEYAWIQAMRDRYGDRVAVLTYDPRLHADWTKAVMDTHPHALGLSLGAISLHARNHAIVAHAAAVLALPCPGRYGGTGGAIRMARSLGRPVYNLLIPEKRAILLKKVA